MVKSFTVSASFRIAVRGWKFSSTRTTCSTFISIAAVDAGRFLATTFLRAIGYGSDEEIIREFYEVEDLKLREDIDEEELEFESSVQRFVGWRNHSLQGLRAAHNRSGQAADGLGTQEDPRR